MAFDLKKHVIRVQGNREYLPVSARLVWFRQEHPDWSIVTNPVEINLEKQYAIFSATIMNAEGKIIATGTKMENIKGFGDFIEKAETGSVGRALAMCGFGTQFAPEMEEGGRFADAPQGPTSAGNRFAPRPNGAPNGNFANRPGPSRPNGPMNGNGNGDGNRPPMPMTVPAEDENPFDSAATAPPTRQQPNRPAAPVQAEGRPSAPSPQREPAVQRESAAQREDAPQRQVAPQREPIAERATPPAPAKAASGGIVRERVKEPEYTDPGGEDEPEGPEGLEDDDPFAEEFAPPAPRTERPAEMPDKLPPTQLGGNRPNPMAGNPGCSSPGCTMKLTPAQVTLSTRQAGRPLCVIHLKEAMSGSQTASAL